MERKVTPKKKPPVKKPMAKPLPLVEVIWVELAKGTEMVMPGDDAKFIVKLITPIAMNEKLNFAIREGGKTVGAGVVTKILE